jgi:hypothetical protein
VSPKNTPMLSRGNLAGAAPRSLRLTSLILLAMEVLSLGHLLLVRHVTCLQHGDVVHVAQSARGPLTQVVEDRLGWTQVSVAATETTLHADHDHCLAYLDTDRCSVAFAARQSLGSDVGVVGAVCGSQTPFFAPVELLLVSPKNSPPSA